MPELAAGEVKRGFGHRSFSRETLVLDFYRRSCDEMQRKIDEALQDLRSLEDCLRAWIGVKLTQLAPNRSVLRALLKNGAAPTPGAPYHRSAPKPKRSAKST